ncbi:MAG: guanylate kinase [Candidatus Aminicenantales bacterium]
MFVLTGPSGCGKSTILSHLLKDLRHLQFSVSHTTRALRVSEVDGREYYFIPPEEFQRMVRRGMFLEWAEVHGNFYGTSKKEIETKTKKGDVVLDIDVQGARSLRNSRPDAVFIFILPPRASDLRKRLIDRGEDSPAVIRRRLENARKEILDAPSFDYVIINDRLNQAILELEAIVLGSRCRADVQKRKIQAVLRSFAPAKR